MHNDLDNKDFAWEPRVVLDGGFRMFVQGLAERPTKKPILLFLPKGASVRFLTMFLGLFSDSTRKTVCLFEDEDIALKIDSLNMPERVRKTTRVVIGDLKFLAKTDKDCYGGCVVLAYGVSMTSPRVDDREHHSYLEDKTHLVAQLCGWNAHVLYLDQPFHDAPEDMLVEMKTNVKVLDLVCEFSATRDISLLGAHFRACGRNVTFICADLAGSNKDAALCLYVQIFRTSGNSRRASTKMVQASLLPTTERAVNFYKKCYGETRTDSPCSFMTKADYDKWSNQEKESNQ
jgi:hypothetical protein